MAGKPSIKSYKTRHDFTSWTEAELDARHEAIVALFPDGMSLEQFEQLCLESAREDGIIHPPSTDMFKAVSALMGMMMRGHVERVNHGYHTPLMPFVITVAGRKHLATLPPLLPGLSHG